MKMAVHSGKKTNVEHVPTASTTIKGLNWALFNGEHLISEPLRIAVVRRQVLQGKDWRGDGRKIRSHWGIQNCTATTTWNMHFFHRAHKGSTEIHRFTVALEHPSGLWDPCFSFTAWKSLSTFIVAVSTMFLLFSLCWWIENGTRIDSPEDDFVVVAFELGVAGFRWKGCLLERLQSQGQGPSTARQSRILLEFRFG